MDLHKEDIPTLDFLLDLLVKRDSHIFGGDLKGFDKYKEPVLIFYNLNLQG